MQPHDTLLPTRRTLRAEAKGLPRPKRYDHCDTTCTVDCGHCKGQGRPTVDVTQSNPGGYGVVIVHAHLCRSRLAPHFDELDCTCGVVEETEAAIENAAEEASEIVRWAKQRAKDEGLEGRFWFGNPTLGEGTTWYAPARPLRPIN